MKKAFTDEILARRAAFLLRGKRGGGSVGRGEERGGRGLLRCLS